MPIAGITDAGATRSNGTVALVAANVAATSGFWPGGRGLFAAEASGWGTAKLQWQNPNGTWIDVDTINASLSANGMVGVELPPGSVRVVLAGTTAAAAWLMGTGIV